VLFRPHPHLASADFIRLLPAATSAHTLIKHSPKQRGNEVYIH